MSSVEFSLNNGEKSANNTLLEVLAQVLNRPLNPVLLHSQLICLGCHSKVVEYIITRDKLQKLELDLISLFDQSSLSQSELGRASTILPSLTDVSTEPLIHENEDQCLANAGQLTSSELTEVVTPVTDDLSSDQDIAESLKERNCVLYKELGNIIDKATDTAKQYVCGKCGKVFSANSHWVEHMLIHIDIKPHKCSQCSKQFRTLSSLKVHERSHSGVKPYDCKICGKFFSERHYLTEHLLVHADYKAFKCNVCNREFSRRKDMMTHIKMHSEERPHSCPQCPKKFVVRSRLNRHLKTHSMDRPYQCKTCQKSFVRHNDFKVHERLHTGVKPYKCTSCNMSFSSLSNCRAHERRHKLAPKVKINNETALDAVAQFNAEYAFSSQERSPSEVLEEGDNVIISREINITKNPGEIMTTVIRPIFNISANQPDELSDISDHLPPLATFDNEIESDKPVLTPNSTLPVDSDLSNVTLSSDEQNINYEQSLVLMQFPLMSEPPPLLLYSPARGPENSSQLANSAPLNDSSDSTLANLTQVPRWDNIEEIDGVNMYHDNSNWSILAHSLF